MFLGTVIFFYSGGVAALIWRRRGRPLGRELATGIAVIYLAIASFLLIGYYTGLLWGARID